MEMNTEDSLREYLRLFVRIPLVGRIGPLARTFDFVADAAPGVKEILAVGKLCYEVRERHYDLVIVDAEASGHIVAQIGAPTRDPRNWCRWAWSAIRPNWMIDILDDPARTGLVIVTTPEEMPVTEIARAGAQGAGRDRCRHRRGVRQPGAAGVVLRARARGVRSVGRRAAAREALVERVGARPSDRCSTPRRSSRRGGGSAPAISIGCAPNRDAARGERSVPLVIVPELFTRATGAAGRHADGPGHRGRVDLRWTADGPSRP